jgi:GMP synthase (glutamine-hydrolysing)
VRILIFNGAPLASQERNVAAGGRSNSALFTAALGMGTPGLEFFTLNVADGEQFPQGMGLGDFDGVVISGSPLNVYSGEARVASQIDLARAIFHAGIPSFGSCWGLQVMTTALGGSVRLNPNGREFGIARAITLTEAGRGHPLFSGKASCFDALCTHEDEVETLPHGSHVLAGNSVSGVQAATIAEGRKVFWGVQYHPEFDFDVIAALLRLRADNLAREGFFSQPEDAWRMADDLVALWKDPTRRDVAWRYGLGPEVRNPELRRLEFTNWIETLVKPFAAARA